MQRRITIQAPGRRSLPLGRSLLVLILVAASMLPALPASATPVAPAIPGAPASATLIDVTIALHSKPDTPEKREPYERIIKYFADGVYEESNGAHKLRNVRIYTGASASNIAKHADVVWVATCHPNGAISGRGKEGMHVNMCDTFSTMNFLADDASAKGGGYTLAHEWGHYFYSMYDEYVGSTSYDSIFGFPHSTDRAVDKAIMNSQWNASGGDFNWLNFSTALNNTRQTAQHRVYGASAWETLVRPVADDPRDGQRAAEPARVYYSELAAVAPAAGSAPAINLPGDARSDLKIIWVDGAIFQIVIDRSGSMDSEGKLANAKTAAKLLVDVAEINRTTIGVIQFDDIVSVVQPLTPVTDQATKNTIKAQIDTITAGNYTAIGDAALDALDGIGTYNAPNYIPAVFLLSDGESNSGTDPLSVIPIYSAAGVPLYTFGYGSDADGATLGQMASGTGGKYYFSPTSIAELTRVFQDANERVSPSVGIAAGTLPPPSSGPSTMIFPLDATLGEVTIAATYAGAQGSVPLNLTGPGGVVGPTPSCTSSASDTLCTFSVVQPAAGAWTLSSTAGAAATAVDYRVSGRGNDTSFTYAASLNSLGGDILTYPQPIVLLAVLGREIPIAGAVVSAEMRTPSGPVVPISLHDDGVAPDVRADDGYYSAIASYSEDGVYNVTVQFDNSRGRAALTTASFQPTIGPNGEFMPLPSPTPVTGNFARFARTQFTVQGTRADDHGDNAGTATNLTPNNTDVPGRIDRSGDVDFFRVDVTGVNAPIARVANLALGMEPRLRIYAEDGTTLLKDANLTNDGNSRGYLSLRLDNATRKVFYLAVSQIDNQTAGGTYDISVGPSVPGDAGAPSGSAVYFPTILRAPAAVVIPLRNGGFEEGPNVGWDSYSSNGYPLILTGGDLAIPAHSGAWAAWLGGAANETSVIEQQVTILPGQPLLKFYYAIGSTETTCGNDVGAILINGAAVQTIPLCKDSSTGGWRSSQVSLAGYAGQTVKLGFRAVLNADQNSNLFLDTVTFAATSASGDGQSLDEGVLSVPVTEKLHQD